MTKTYEEFREYFEPEMFFAPKKTAINKIREAVIEFCEQSRLVLLDATVIDIVADTKEYAIVFDPAYYLPVEIGKAYLGDGTKTDTELTVTSRRRMDMSVANWSVLETGSDITHVFLTKTRKVRVYPIADSDIDDHLYLKDVAVKPKRDATQIVDFIYDDYLEDIKHGALYFLKQMKGQDWYNSKIASHHRDMFYRAIADAKGERLQGLADYSGSSMF